jgi:hypothetical protein
VKAGNPRLTSTVNWEICILPIALYLSVIKRTCNQGTNKSNHPTRTRYFRHAYHPTRESISNDIMSTA